MDTSKFRPSKNIEDDRSVSGALSNLRDQAKSILDWEKRFNEEMNMSPDLRGPFRSNPGFDERTQPQAPLVQQPSVQPNAAAPQQAVSPMPAPQMSVPQQPMNIGPAPSGMSPDVYNAIVRAANQYGVDPSFALAVAQRESSFNPNAQNSKSIFGLYQMSGPLRAQYGSGSSTDPYTQASAWMKFITDTRNGMQQRLGRPVTDAEAYMGHYFGESTGARVAGGMDPSTPVQDVFSPEEMRANPNFARAGTIGNLANGITSDINRREASFNSMTPPSAPQPQATAPLGFASPQPQQQQQPQAQTQPQGPQFSGFGPTSDEIQQRQAQQQPTFSAYGGVQPEDMGAASASGASENAQPGA